MKNHAFFPGQNQPIRDIFKILVFMKVTKQTDTNILDDPTVSCDVGIAFKYRLDEFHS
jgi:hypothetical protein